MSEPQSSASVPLLAPEPDLEEEPRSNISESTTEPAPTAVPIAAAVESSTQQQPSFKVYRPPKSSVAPLPALSDEYFNPSASELRLHQQQLTARTQAMTNAPLQLKAAREAAEKLKRDRWPETRIRVKFPDMTQLEKVFPSTDKIKSIYAFVRNSLREDVKPIKFILYQPPRNDLKVSDPQVKPLSLAELHLAPSSVLLLRFEDESLNAPSGPSPLAQEVLALAEDFPAPPPESSYNPSKGASSSAGQTIKSTLAAGEKKIPKWFKMGKK